MERRKIRFASLSISLFLLAVMPALSLGVELPTTTTAPDGYQPIESVEHYSGTTALLIQGKKERGRFSF